MSGKLDADEEEWPCVGTSSSSFFGGKCTVCSTSRPCLFNLLEDEGERVNLAPQQPEIVAKLAKQLDALDVPIEHRLCKVACAYDRCH